MWSASLQWEQTSRCSAVRHSSVSLAAGGFGRVYWACSFRCRTLFGVGVSRQGGAEYWQGTTGSLLAIATCVTDGLSSCAEAALMRVAN